MYTLPKPLSSAMILFGGLLFLVGNYLNFSFSGILMVFGILLLFSGWLFAPAKNAKEFITRAAIILVMFALLGFIAFRYFI
jgi:hypothetical protein